MVKQTGEYQELDAPSLDGGKLIKLLTDQIREAYAGLQTHLDDSDDIAKAKSTVTCQIEIIRDKKGEFATINYVINHKIPKKAKGTYVRAMGGKLLLDEDTKGAALNGTLQMQMFNREGEPTHKIDTSTGEVVQEPDVAGKIN